MFAAKDYGDQKNEFVLCVHGIQDNCGTFDRLIPHLPPSFYYVCIDLPSHGISSRIPGMMPIHTIDYLLVYKLILDYFNRKEYIILGHSYGGQVAIHFAQIYPEYIIKLILLDTIFLYPYIVTQYKHNIKNHHMRYMKMLENEASPETKPSYTYEEVIEKTKEKRFSELNSEAVELLLKRNIEKTEDGKYRFTLDPRLKFFLNPSFDMRFATDLLRKYPINCPLLIILASDFSQREYFASVLKVLTKNKNCYVKIVNGNHDVHNNHPERVYPYINKFLLQKKNKL